MSILLRIVVIVIGLFSLYYVLYTLKKRQMSEANCVLWIVSAIVLIILGIFPQLTWYIADLFHVYWAPSVLFFFVIVLLSFILFSHTKSISIMNAQLMELSMQLSVLKKENEQLRKELEK